MESSEVETKWVTWYPELTLPYCTYTFGEEYWGKPKARVGKGIFGCSGPST